MKPIIVSSHAFDRLQERGIVREQIELAILTPELKAIARHGKLKVVRRFGRRVLHVFYRETRHSIYLVTAYWRWV